MPFSEYFLDELSERTDIVELVGRYVPLTKQGNRHFGRCPFHSEKSASFCVTPERSMFYCFGCHAGGGVFQFVMRIENCSFSEAVASLAERAGLKVPEVEARPGRPGRERLWEVNAVAARWFHENLSQNRCAAVADYLAGRRISARTARKFGLGAAPDSFDSLCRHLETGGVTHEEMDACGLLAKSAKGVRRDAFRNRLMFPIFDVRGKVIAFSGRAVTGDAGPKYKNTAESYLYAKRKTIFALNFAKDSPESYFILTEGNIDVVMLHQNGFSSAVATCGTALTAEQAKLMARYKKEVVVAYDADNAGIAATQKAIAVLDGAGFKVRVLKLPAGMDPDGYVAAYGMDAFGLLLSGAENHMEYRINQLQSGFDLTQNTGRAAFLREGIQLLLGLPAESERYIYAERLARAAGVSKEAVENDLKRGVKRRAAKEDKAAEMALVYPRNTLDKAEEILLACLIQNPERLDETTLPREAFSLPVLRSVYAHILEGRAIYHSELSEEESGLAARLLSSETYYGEQAYGDCLAKVLEQYELRKAAEDGADELILKFNRLKTKKKYGG